MSIICPNCNTNFSLSKEEIGIVGRKVKCSQCKHIWYYKIDITNQRVLDYEPTNPNISDYSINNPSTKDNDKNLFNTTHSEVENNEKIKVENNRNLPVPIESYEGKSEQPKFTIPILLVNIIFFLVVLLFHDDLNKFTSHYKKDPELVISEVKVDDHEKELGKILLSYKITNVTTQNVVIPMIRVRLLDKKYLTVKSYIMDQKNIKLSPNNYIEINTNLDTIPITGKIIDITIGNSFDFILQ